MEAQHRCPPEGLLCPRVASSLNLARDDTRQTSALRGTTDALLDTAYYGVPWVLLCPAAPGLLNPWRRRRRGQPRGDAGVIEAEF